MEWRRAGSLVEAVVIDMAGGPRCAGVLNAHGLEMKRSDHAAIVSGVCSKGGHAVHGSRQLVGCTIIIEMAKVRIKGAVFLGHKNDVIDCRYARVGRRQRRGRWEWRRTRSWSRTWSWS